MRWQPSGPFVHREDESRVRSAFPGVLPSDLAAMLRALPLATHESSADDIGPLMLHRESVHIPYRIYAPEPPEHAVATLSEQGQTMLACWYTRHHDGLVRERHLRRVLACEAEPWTPPFVVQLLGEYVRELLDVLAAHTEALQGAHYLRFSEENAPFVQLTKQRIISYWACYQRREFPRFRDYVGFQLADTLRWWLPPERKRWLER